MRLREIMDTRRKRRRILLFFAMLFIFWLIGKCSGGRWVTPPPLVFVPKGDHARIAQAMRDQGMDISDEDIIGQLRSKTIEPGWVRFDDHAVLDYKEFFDKLSSIKRERTRRVVMFSGDTIHLFAQKLSSQTHLSKGELLNAYYDHSPYSDGGILSGFYRLPYRITPDAAMYYMTKSTTNSFRRISAKYGMEYEPEQFKKYLITASVIQKETWHTEEMPLIASVIRNRLKKGIKLQLDGTLNYGPYAHTPVTPQRIRSDESRFNTYKHKGLPPEPIGSVGKEALESAFAPADTQYMFFVKGANGKHLFTKTYQDHLGLIQSIKNKKAMMLAVDQNISEGSSPIVDLTENNDTNVSAHPPGTKHQ